jgi:hypothetical protein
MTIQTSLRGAERAAETSVAGQRTGPGIKGGSRPTSLDYTLDGQTPLVDLDRFHEEGIDP